MYKISYPQLFHGYPWIRYFLKAKKTIKGRNSGPLLSEVLVFVGYSGVVTPLE